MADYYAILKRAVDSLPDSTREQRQAVYDKARTALLAQLQGMNPPLPPAEISKQRVALEESVRSVERDLMLAKEAAEKEASAADSGVNAGPAAEKGAAPFDGEAKASVKAQASASVSAPSVSASPNQAMKAPPVSVAPSGDKKAGAEASAAPSVSAPSTKVADASEAAGEDRVVSRAGRDVLKNAVRDAEKLGAATNAAVRSAQETADMVGEQRSGDAARIEPTLGDAVVSSATTYKKPVAKTDATVSVGEAGSSDARSSDVLDDEEGSGSGFGLVATLLIVAVVLGGSGYLLYQNKDAFLGPVGGSTSGQETESDAGGTPPASDAKDETASGAAGDTEMTAKNVRTVTVTPQGTVETTPASDPSSSNETMSGSDGQVASDLSQDQAGTMAEPAGDDQTGAETQAQTPVPTNEQAAMPQGSVSVSQAIYYEEKAGASSEGSATAGTTQWSLEGEGAQATVVASADVPARDLKFTLRIAKNADASLPASHLIEIAVEANAEGEAIDIVEIPGLILKPTEQSRGQGLVGAAIRISGEMHWIALTAGEKEIKYNMELLDLRNWVDMPILFQSGQRAILTLQKGPLGDEIIKSAQSEWEK
ncbi:MAG: hypothetical protein N4A65_02000 [Cohaesibacter sp.]|jgi:hypothetical protein|nr:hypothetical protein [Cohaesibacter sp.]